MNMLMVPLYIQAKYYIEHILCLYLTIFPSPGCEIVGGVNFSCYQIFTPLCCLGMPVSPMFHSCKNLIWICLWYHCMFMGSNVWNRNICSYSPSDSLFIYVSSFMKSHSIFNCIIIKYTYLNEFYNITQFHRESLFPDIIKWGVKIW